MKIATALDRPPSQYFKKWVTYHSTLFNKEDFIFINFRENDNELREYLESKGFSDITSLTIIEIRHGRFELFDEHLNRYLDAGISGDTTFILNCPLENITSSNTSFYRNFVLDSTHIINRVKAKVLQHNHKFIFLDSDELIVCNDINALLDTDFTQIVPAGYTVVQTSKESELNWGIPIHKQRSFWKREAYFYDKPIIVQEDIHWGPGRHVHHHDPIPVNENVTLFHLRDVCFNYLYNENLCTKAIYLDQPEDHRRKWEDKSEYDTWVEQRQLELTPIINEVKVLLKKYNI